MTKVIKIGGAVVDDEVMLGNILDRCATLAEPFVLVHGGGKIATEIAHALGIKQTMINGRRVTDADTLRLVTMVYAGFINKNIVAKLHARGILNIGMTGADADLVRAHRRVHESVDYGFVGDIDHVNADVMATLLNAGISVVVAPLTHDGMGQLLNTNADTMAAMIAKAYQHADVQLVYLFEFPGVMRNLTDATSVIPVINVNDIDGLIEDGTISKGMVPKITNAADAARAGINVRIQHISALGTDEGTLITC